jgi:predicted dehydrogenase
MEKVRIGIIGVGGIANGVHIPKYLECEDCVITAVCDIDEKRLKETGDRLNIPESARFADYRDLINSGLVDVVDIATSNDVHVEISLAALEAGLPVSVEKPIGITFEESLALRKKSEETGLPVFVCFSWRYRGTAQYMKKLIDDGEIGEIYHIYINCIKDSGLWEGRRLEWRFDEKRAGTGVLCDLGSHMFDAIRFFGKEIESVSCDRGIIVKKRQLLDSDDWADVTTDDWANATCVLDGGANATVILSRTAIAEANTTEFYVTGSKGALKLSSVKGETLELCSGEDLKTKTFKTLEIPAEFSGANQSRSFINIVKGIKDEFASDIFAGIKSQAAVDAAKLSSETGKKILIEEMFKI